MHCMSSFGDNTGILTQCTDHKTEKNIYYPLACIFRTHVKISIILQGVEVLFFIGIHTEWTNMILDNKPIWLCCMKNILSDF